MDWEKISRRNFFKIWAHLARVPSFSKIIFTWKIFPILVQSTKKFCSFCHWKCLGIEPEFLIKLEVLLDAELRTLATRPLDLLLFSFKKFVPLILNSILVFSFQFSGVLSEAFP